MKNALRISLIAIISVLMLSAAIAGGKKPAWVVNTEVKAKRSGDAIIGWGEYKRNSFGPTCYYVVAHGTYEGCRQLGDSFEGPFVKVYFSSLLDDRTLDAINYMPLGQSHMDFSRNEMMMASLTDQTPAIVLAEEVTSVLSKVLPDVSLKGTMRVKK